MSELQKLRVMLVDDHRILLDGIKQLLQAEPDMEVVAEATDARMGMNLLSFLPVDILVSDLSLPDVQHTDFIQEVRKKFPALKVLVLSMHDESELLRDVLKTGVEGYVLKSNSREELVRAIRQIHLGERYLSPEVSLKLLEQEQRNHNSVLTDREIEIVRLIAKEYSNKQIADALFISERTVESHRKNIFRKSETHSVVGLIKYAMQHKLL
jgi:DNA-binding NarL/FixJ family response regulator